MHKEFMASIPGIGNYAAIALVIFVAFFIGLIGWVVCMSKRDANRFGALPLDSLSPSGGDNHERQ